MSYRFKTYSEMLEYENFGDRLEYLKLKGIKHESPRAISNKFYKSKAWLNCRREIIRRDLGCDLAAPRLFINGPMLVHHINPLTQDDIELWSDKLFDPENLITVSEATHNRIHYFTREVKDYMARKPGDTKLW